MKIIIGHLMCSLLFKMMMLIVHAWLTSFFPPVVGCIQLYGILGGGFLVHGGSGGDTLESNS